MSDTELNGLGGGPSLFEIEDLLKMVASQGISDVHLRVGTPPVVRKDGMMMKTTMEPISVEDIERTIKKIMPQKFQEKINQLHDFDFSFEMEGVSRFRVNFLHDLGNPALVFRIVPFRIPSIESLYLPPVLKNFTTLNNGLVLITGPTGCGKSTTLASILDHLNQNSQKHIITLEDPIEFIHMNKKSVFTQRQLGVDTDTFPNGLKYALRQDPDVILIGEMRDRDTINSALKAAETGHLVFSTLHTTDAVQTINRIINYFEPHERESIRIQIAQTLQGTIAQKLIKKADNKGRVPATEILVATPAVKDYIMRDEIDKIYELIKAADYDEMLSMNRSMLRLVQAKLITQETALKMSDNSVEMEIMLKGAFHGTSSYIEQ